MKMTDDIMMYNGRRVSLVFEDILKPTPPNPKPASAPEEKGEEDGGKKKYEAPEIEELDVSTIISTATTPSEMKLGMAIEMEGDGKYTVQLNDIFIWQNGEVWNVKVITPNNEGGRIMSGNYVDGLQKLGIVDDNGRPVSGRINTIFNAVQEDSGIWRYTVVDWKGFQSELLQQIPDTELTPEDVAPGKIVMGEKVDGDDLVVYTEDGRT